MPCFPFVLFSSRSEYIWASIKGFRFQGTWIVLLFERWASGLWRRTQQGLWALPVWSYLRTRFNETPLLLLCSTCILFHLCVWFDNVSFFRVGPSLLVFVWCSVFFFEKTFFGVTGMQGITLSGTRITPFTLLGTQLEHRLSVCCSKCLLIRWVHFCVWNQ